MNVSMKSKTVDAVSIIFDACVLPCFVTPYFSMNKMIFSSHLLPPIFWKYFTPSTSVRRGVATGWTGVDRGCS